MNIYSLIKKDHDEARDLMDEILKTDDVDERLDLFQDLKIAILSHAKSEEKTFYASLRKNADESLKKRVPSFKEEHREAEQLFAEIEEIDPQSNMWWERYGELRKALTHHMKEEEKEVFKDAKKEIPKDEAQELGEEMEALEEDRKEELSREEEAA